MKKALIFDFFGVISTTVIPIVSKRSLTEAEVRLINDIDMRDIERGEITEQDFLEKISKIVGKPAPDIHTEWQEYIKIDTGVVELIKQLRSKYKIGLCTNAFSWFLNPILDQNELRELFDGIVISDEIHYVKPAPEMYVAILDRLAVSPGEALFIDDQIINIEGAERCGIEGLLFNSVEQLRILL